MHGDDLYIREVDEYSEETHSFRKTKNQILVKTRSQPNCSHLLNFKPVLKRPNLSKLMKKLVILRKE